MKNKKYDTVETIPKSNIKMTERGKFDTPNTQIHDRSLSWLGTGTSIKRGGVMLVWWGHASAFRMWVKWKNVSKEILLKLNI